MFEKNTENILYNRERYTMEEQLFDIYMNMRKLLGSVESFKYESIDNFKNSEDFKQGFIAGVKIMSSILLDL